MKFPKSAILISLVLVICRAASVEQELDDVGIDHFDKQQPGCPKIHDLRPIVDFKELVGEWRVPFMSSTWIRGLAHSIHLATSFKNPGLERACIKLSLLPMPHGKSQSNSSILIVSKCPKTGMTHDLECEPSEDMDSEWYCGDMRKKAMRLEEDAKPAYYYDIIESEFNDFLDGYYVYIFQDEFSNGYQYALAVKCFPKSGLNWAIVTKEKVIDPKIIKHFLGKVRSMGFDTNNIIELPYEKC